MFDWLKRPRRKKDAFVRRGAGSTDAAAAPASDDEMRQAFRQAAMKFLQDRHGLDPTYLPDLQSAEEFNAEFETMPLIAVWNEKQVDGEVVFSTSINGFLVYEALAQFLSTDDPWLKEELAHLVTDLKQLTSSSMVKSVEKTGLMPSEIFAALALGS